MQVAAWAVWALLGGGALLTTLSLLQGVGRFRQWKSLHAEQDGEIVLADRALETGQRAQVACPVLPRPLNSCLTGLFRRTLQLTVEAPNDGSPLIWPPIGATVTVSLTGAGEQYLFSARVRDHNLDAGELQLSRPTWLARVQRRRHVRADLCLPAIFERTTPPQLAFPLHGSILNLSGGGFRAEIGDGIGSAVAEKLITAFAPETVLRVRMPLPSISEPLLARVVTCKRVAVRGGLAVRMTCEFLPLSAIEEEALIHYVFRQHSV